jgi:hypothetical protein
MYTYATYAVTKCYKTVTNGSKRTEKQPPVHVPSLPYSLAAAAAAPVSLLLVVLHTKVCAAACLGVDLRHEQLGCKVHVCEGCTAHKSMLLLLHAWSSSSCYPLSHSVNASCLVTYLGLGVLGCIVHVLVFVAALHTNVCPCKKCVAAYDPVVNDCMMIACMLPPEYTRSFCMVLLLHALHHHHHVTH